MSKKAPVQLRDINKDPIIKEALYLADYMYEKAGTPEFSDDERWRLARELKDVSALLVSETAMAVGGDGLSGAEYLWVNVRKQISRLRTDYQFVAKRNFLQIDPRIMVRIDKFIQLVDKQVPQSYDLSDKNSRKEFNLYVKRHKLWKEMNDDES